MKRNQKWSVLAGTVLVLGCQGESAPPMHSSARNSSNESLSNVDVSASNDSLVILYPGQGAVLGSAETEVRGNISNGIRSVAVNGIPADIRAGSFFLHRLRLDEGENEIKAVARVGTDSYNESLKSSTRVRVDTQAPRVDWVDLPSDNAQLCSFSLDPRSDVRVTDLSLDRVLIDVNGKEVRETTRFVEAGSLQLRVRASDLAGHSMTAERRFEISSSPDCLSKRKLAAYLDGHPELFSTLIRGALASSTDGPVGGVVSDLLSLTRHRQVAIDGERVFALAPAVALESFMSTSYGGGALEGTYLRTDELADVVSFLSKPDVRPWGVAAARSLFPETAPAALAWVETDGSAIAEKWKEVLRETMLRDGIQAWLHKALVAFGESAESGLQARGRPSLGEGMFLAAADVAMWRRLRVAIGDGYLENVAQLGALAFELNLVTPMLVTMNGTRQESDFSNRVGQLFRSEEFLTVARVVGQPTTNILPVIGELLRDPNVNGPVIQALSSFNEAEWRDLGSQVTYLSTPPAGEASPLERLFSLIGATEYRTPTKVFGPFLQVARADQKTSLEEMLEALDTAHRPLECLGATVGSVPSLSEMFLRNIAQTSFDEVLEPKSFWKRRIKSLAMTLCPPHEGEVRQWEALARIARGSGFAPFESMVRSLSTKGKLREFLDINRVLVKSGVYESVRPLMIAASQSGLIDRYFSLLIDRPAAARGLAQLAWLMAQPLEDHAIVGERLLAKVSGVAGSNLKGVERILSHLAVSFREKPEQSRELMSRLGAMAARQDWAVLSGELFGRWQAEVGGRFAHTVARMDGHGKWLPWLKTTLEDHWIDPYVEFLKVVAEHDEVGVMPRFWYAVMESHRKEGKPASVISRKLLQSGGTEIRDLLVRAAVDWSESPVSRGRSRTASETYYGNLRTMAHSPFLAELLGWLDGIDRNDSLEEWVSLLPRYSRKSYQVEDVRLFDQLARDGQLLNFLRLAFRFNSSS